MAQSINVDIKPGLFQPTLHFSQGDIGREFAIKIVTSDGFSVPVGATVDLVGTKPSGFGFTVPCTVSGNTVTFASSDTDGEVFTDEHGIFPAELVIKNNGDVIGTANFFFSGEKNPHPTETIDGEAEQIIPELTLLVERVETAASSILDMQVVANTLPAGSDATYSYDEETNTATFGIPKGADGSLASGVLAPTYSSSATYAVGDYVYYSGDLYRCIIAITSAEVWTAGHWEQVAIAEEVSKAIKTNGETIEAYTELFDRSKATLGRSLWSNTDEENPNYGYTDYIDVANADITMGNKEDNNNTIVYYDENKTRIPPNGVIKNFDSSNLPTGTVYIRFNFALSAIDLVSVVKNETLNCISTEIISDYPNHTTLYLGAGCQFTTLKSAVEYANSIASKYNVVDIMIKEGVYNVFDGYDLTAQPANWWGLYVEDYVNLIGIGSADKVVINGALPVDISAYAFDRQNISTLNFWKNNTLKNVTVTAKNIRYCLHNEDGKSEAVDNAKELFENVVFIYYENDAGVITSRVPVGVGASHGRHTTFKNCVFENQSSHGNYPVLIHNNTTIDTYCVWNFESCDFIGGILNSLKLSSAGSGQTEIVNIKGCKMPHGILFTKENVYTGSTCEYKLFGYGNSIQGGYTFDGVTEDTSVTDMML